jgi:hypothetical protein
VEKAMVYFNLEQDDHFAPPGREQAEKAYRRLQSGGKAAEK